MSAGSDVLAALWRDLESGALSRSAAVDLLEREARLLRGLGERSAPGMTSDQAAELERELEAG